jgi:hypothetical protein
MSVTLRYTYEDDLIGFVISEIGRAAEQNFEKSLPLCLYFDTEEDREEFIAAFRKVHPNAFMKKMM